MPTGTARPAPSPAGSAPACLPVCHLCFLKDIRQVPHPGVMQCVVPTNTQAQWAVHLMRLCRRLSPHPEGSPGPSRQGSRGWPAPSPPAWDSAQPPPFRTPASLETQPHSVLGFQHNTPHLPSLTFLYDWLKSRLSQSVAWPCPRGLVTGPPRCPTAHFSLACSAVSRL